MLLKVIFYVNAKFLIIDSKFKEAKKESIKIDWMKLCD